jgi:hypothetical protein
MIANYSFDIDQSRRIVRIKLGGFFGAGEVARFAEAQARAYASLPHDSERHLTLCDISDCKIQLQEVVDGFRRLIEDPKRMSRRIAFVTGNSPARMQIRRLATRDNARVFDCAVEAELWLLSA